MDLNRNFEYLQIGLSDDILRRKVYGDFEGAIQLIDRKLKAGDQSQAFRNCLIVQREMMVRLPENYPYTKEQAIARVQKYIPDFTEAEFDERELNGEIEWIYIQGIPYYFDRFYESLIKTDAAFAARAGVKNMVSDGGTIGRDMLEDPLDRIARKMRDKGSISNRICVRASVRIKDEYFKKGELVRVHLPIPCDCPQQGEIRIERMEPPDGQVAPEDALQRTICWEERMTENHTFMVEYSYVYTAQYHDVDSIVPDEKQPSFDIHEQPPHIMFTPYIRELAKSLTQGLKSPLEKARSIYDFVTLNVKYSFMRSYFCLESIPETGARNQRGDCGVMALLFITLCRYAGIPACWQSGLVTRPDFCGAHDWTMFYVAPYGWLYADPSFGAGAVREQNEERRQFYFGNLDPFRMVANSQFQGDFTVPKEFWRADPYDNQVGEIENDHRGLRYFEFDRSKEIIKFEEL
jgi:transglutaminase-like putative cysteine protease